MPQYFRASRNVQIAGLDAICRAIWKSRNKARFEKKFPKNLVDLIYQYVDFIKYLAGSHNAVDASQLQQGVDALLNLAMGLAARRSEMLRAQVVCLD
jgi:hypothetical protein